MQTSSHFSVVTSRSNAPSLRLYQDTRNPQRLRVSGSFGEVCRALEALTQSERVQPAQPNLFGLLAH